MPFRKIILFIHLWLGLISGLIVCFLGITGCMLVFQKEIEQYTIPGQAISSNQFLPPSILKSRAENALESKYDIQRIEYQQRDRSAMAFHYSQAAFYIVYLNPYTGEVKMVRDMNRDFFRFILKGHYNLWLPPAIGQTIIATATLVFVLMLLTGIILWWPQTPAAIRQRFLIQANSGWKKLNYQLHNVLGFYIVPVVIIIAITGLIMGFQWFARGSYLVSSGGKSMPAFPSLVSQHSFGSNWSLDHRIDSAWSRYLPSLSKGDGMAISFPSSATATINISVNHRPGTYTQQDNYYLDQYSLKALDVAGIYTGRFKDAGFPDKLVRMNYDLHVGSIGGLPTKIIAFFASLIAASLPVTGFLIWLNRTRQGFPSKKLR